MSEAESIDDTGDEAEEDEEPHPYDVLDEVATAAHENLVRIKKAGKAMAADGDVKGSKALLEISGTVLPLLADVAQATMELDDNADEREKEINRRFAIIEATMLTPEDAGSHIASLGALRAYIDNMIAATIAQAATEGKSMTPGQEQLIEHYRGMADGIVRTQLYLERFVAFGQAVEPGDEEEESDEDPDEGEDDDS